MDKIIVFLCFIMFPLLSNSQETTISGPLANEPAKLGFSAISVRKSSSPITVNDKEYFKTTREHFNQALADYKSNPAKSWKNSPLAPKDMNGKPLPIPKRKLFYSPLEKE